MTATETAARCIAARRVVPRGTSVLGEPSGEEKGVFMAVLSEVLTEQMLGRIEVFEHGRWLPDGN